MSSCVETGEQWLAAAATSAAIWWSTLPTTSSHWTSPKQLHKHARMCRDDSRYLCFHLLSLENISHFERMFHKWKNNKSTDMRKFVYHICIIRNDELAISPSVCFLHLFRKKISRKSGTCATSFRDFFLACKTSFVSSNKQCQWTDRNKKHRLPTTENQQMASTFLHTRQDSPGMETGLWHHYWTTE